MSRPAEVRPPLPAAPGRVAKRDSEYERRGTANVFCGVEAKAGRHCTGPRACRAGPEFTKVIRALAGRYPGAHTLPLGLANLNIHGSKSRTD